MVTNVLPLEVLRTCGGHGCGPHSNTSIEKVGKRLDREKERNGNRKKKMRKNEEISLLSCLGKKEMDQEKDKSRKN